MNLVHFENETSLDEITSSNIMHLTKQCVYCGASVTISKEEEKMFISHGVNLSTVRISCPLCSDRKIQPMQSEDS
jgi:hypothetical protein